MPTLEELNQRLKGISIDLEKIKKVMMMILE
jgi:hypothetical protein